MADAICGLLTPARLDAHLVRAIEIHDRTSQDFAYLICTIDDVDSITAELGPAAVEQLVRAVALRITDAVRARDVITRSIAGPFIIVAADTDSDGAAYLARRLIEVVEGAVDLDGTTVWASISIGAASSSDVPAEQVSNAAALALLDATLAGCGNIVVFDPATPVDDRSILAMCNEPDAAAGTGRLRLGYQPIVRISTNEVIGAEARISGMDETVGEISHRHVIAAAETGGLMRNLGRWALRQACVDASKWHGSRFVAVDVSPAQFSDELLVDVRDALAASGLRPDQLRLELDEMVLSADSGRAREVLRRVEDLGVGISLDGFGAGGCAMARLRDLPLHAVKIDRTFVGFLGRAPDDTVIGTALVDLAGGLGLPILADGVESVEQARMLHLLGCEYGQGPLWNPVPSAQEFVVAAEAIERHGAPTLRVRADLSVTVPEPDAAVMATILKLHRLGASPAGIAAALNEDGIASPTGTRWRQVAVARLIAQSSRRHRLCA